MASDNAERLLEIEARVAAATPGPWSAQANSGWIHGGGGVICDIETVEDQDFIAAARADVPWLIDQVRAWQARVAELEAQAAGDEGDQDDDSYCDAPHPTQGVKCFRLQGHGGEHIAWSRPFSMGPAKLRWEVTPDGK